MAEPNPVVTSSPPPMAPEQEVYRPLSLPAVAGLCLSLVYTVPVLIVAAVALFKGAQGPIPIPTWFVIFAVGGAVLSYVGLKHIGASEGTRAGTAVARWGLWLSIPTALAYLSVTFATKMAVTQQADRFLTVSSDDDSGFFARLQAGTPEETYRAFLMTMEYSKRAGYDPRNPAKIIKDFDQSGPMGDEGLLSKFRDHPIVLMIQSGGKDTQIEALGVEEWGFAEGGYKVSRKYRIRAPEAERDITVSVRSTEGEDSEGIRKWFVMMHAMMPGPGAMTLTPLGEAMRETRLLAKQAADRWLDDAKTKKKFDLRDDSKYDKVAPPTMPRDVLPERIRDILQGSDPEIRARVIASPEDQPTPWTKLPDGRLELVRELAVIVEQVKGLPPFRARIHVYMQTKTPFDPMQRAQPPAWELTKFEVVRVSLMTTPKMMMPGG